MRVFEKNVRAVIFDMDGTLLDSERISRKAWDAGAREFGLSVPAELFQKMVGYRTADCLKIMREVYGNGIPSESIGAAANKYYLRLVNAGVPVMPGAREAIEFCRRENLKIGVATSSRRVIAEKKLRQVGLWEFVSAATCGDEVSAGKPDPEIYLTTAEKLGVPATQCVAVEDSPTGFRAAFSAGCVPVLVPDLIAPAGQTLSDAAAVLESLREFSKLFS